MKILLFVLFLFAVIWAQDESWKIYDDSEVAIINITTAPEVVEYMYTFPESDSLHLASVHFKNAQIDESIDSVAFRIRGNTSRESEKKSFKLDFEHFVNGREFYNLDKINLNGEHNDPSIIRSKLAWDFFQDIGMISSRAAHAAVYINDVYYGLYISIEHYDKEFLKKHFADPSGNLWKCLYPANLNFISNVSDDYKLADNGRPVYDLKTNEEFSDYSQLARLINIINNTPSENFKDSLESVINVPEALQLLAADVLLGSWDDYIFLANNYYLYHDPTANKFTMIPYDYDNIMGIDWFNEPWAQADPYGWPKAGWFDASRPLFDRMLEVDEYWDLYTHFLKSMNDNIFKLSLWDSKLDDLYNKIYAFAEQDTFRTRDYGFTMDDFTNSYSYEYYFPEFSQHVKRGIREYVSLRNTSLDQQLYFKDATPMVYEINHYPLKPHAGDSIHIAVSAFSNAGFEKLEVQLQISGQGIVQKIPLSFEPKNDSKIIAEQDLWQATIAPLGANAIAGFKIFAEDVNGKSQAYPRSEYVIIKTTGSGNTNLKINEFLASNSTTNTDEAGQYDDWLELYNSSLLPIEIAGYYLTDNDSNLTKWQIPEDTPALQGGAFLLVWCDEDQSQGKFHTNFKIRTTGEFLALTASDGVTVIDSFTFGAQSADISYGRIPDGADSWDFLVPSPGSANPVTNLANEHAQPRVFNLSLFPNPFNSSLKIQYEMPVAGDVGISIYDTKGSNVWSKKEINVAAGIKTIRWDGKSIDGDNLSSGVYLININTGNFQKQAKVVLIK